MRTLPITILQIPCKVVFHCKTIVNCIKYAEDNFLKNLEK